MATLLDAPKPPSSAKVEEFVDKQLRAARRRVRVLDFFINGLALAVVTLVFVLAVLLVDRYVETPPGTGWAVVLAYLALAAGYLYLTLFRPSRRQINPYFAARQVEQKVPNAKNSLVTWVDLEEDQKVPGSIRTAIGQKAARDLKQVDLNRAIENRKIIWLAVIAVALLTVNVVVAFLPPTRTELTLVEPTKGDATVFSNQDVSFQVRVHGRIPDANDADAVRLRLWYNPEDPETYEDRPMQVAEGDRRQFSLTILAKQTRTGFQYKVLAGNTETAEYTVTVKIIPEFTGFDVAYAYPAYLKREPETNNDPNLVAPYGTTATILATTNREVKHGHIEIEGQPRTIDGQLVEGRPDAIQFTVPIEKEGYFRIWFTTPEGDKNQDPARLRLGVIDPKPVVREFDLQYDYPAYLRFKPMTAAGVRDPEIEAPRGTRVTVTAKTTRAVKDAKIELPGLPPVAGELVADQPTWVRFKLPPIDKDATGSLTFTPNSAENPSAPRSIPIRALIDEAPRVEIKLPEPDTVDIPANGTLTLEGLATDDHGVDKLTLRMKVLGAEDRDLASKPYRGGMSFLRKEDNSWPTRVEYKDFVKLQDLRMPGNLNWRIAPGIEVEYWVEALDNCAVPGPNPGMSKPKRFKVIAPKPPEAAKKDQQAIERKQKDHEKKQDDQNKTEKRDVQQPPPKGAENADKRDNPQQDPMGDPMGAQENRNQGDQGQPKDGQPKEGAGDPNHDQRTEDVKKALNQAEQDKQPGGARGATPPDAKVDPSEARPEPKKGPEGAPPPSEDRTPKENPNQDKTGDGAAGEARGGNVDQSKEEKGDGKGAGTPPPAGMSEEPKGEEKRTYGGSDENAGQAKPDAKDKPEPKAGGPKSEPTEKAAARPQQPKKSDGSEPGNSEQPAPGETRPDRDVTASEDKKAGREGGPKGAEPPADTASSKPQQSPEPGGARPKPKDDQVADASSGRQPPKDGADDAGTKPDTSPKGGTGTEQAKSESRGSSGTPPPKGGGDQGDLDRELGELEREINSTNPKMDDRKQSDVDRLMRNPETREKTRQKLKDIEKNANDELTKKKARDALESGERAAKDYDNERPNTENVEQLSKKLNSKDEKDRRDAENRIKDWEKNPETRDELKNQTDELKKKDRDAGERVENATNRAEQARNEKGGKSGSPKVNEQDLKDIAKDLGSSDPKAQADAQKKLEKMMQDPKTRQETQDKLNEMAKNAKGQEQEDLKNAAQQAGKMGKELAKKDPPAGKGPDPKDLEKAARDLASNDPKAREQAKRDLEKMMQDPKTRQQAKDMLDQMAKDAKTPEDKQAFENAAKQASELAKERGPQPTEKIDPKDLKDLADKMAGEDSKAKQDATDKLNEMMKDPKAREQAMKMLEEMAKDAKNSPEQQKALDEALKQAKEMAKKDPPKLDPKDLKDIAKKFEDMDPKAKDEMKRQFEEAMKDPKRREEMQKLAEEMAKNTPPEQKKQFDEMMRQLGGDFQSPPSTPEKADLANRLKSAELLLDEFKKNIQDDKFRQRLQWTKEQEEQWIKDQEAAIAAMKRQAEKSDFRTDRTARSAAQGGFDRVKLDPKVGADALRGGRATPPANYADAYKKFAGGGQASEPKR
jgi:hypothetical protein